MELPARTFTPKELDEPNERYVGVRCKLATDLTWQKAGSCGHIAKILYIDIRDSTTLEATRREIRIYFNFDSGGMSVLEPRDLELIDHRIGME